MAATSAHFLHFPPVVVIVGGHSWQASTNAGTSMIGMVLPGRACRQISFVTWTPRGYLPRLTPRPAGRLAPSPADHGGRVVAVATRHNPSPKHGGCHALSPFSRAGRSAGVHAHRAACGDRHHRGAYRPAPPGRPEGPGGRGPDEVPEQPQANRARLYQLSVVSITRPRTGSTRGTLRAERSPPGPETRAGCSRRSGTPRTTTFTTQY